MRSARQKGGKQTPDEELENPADDIDFELIAKGRDRGGKPSQLSEEERERRKLEWRKLREALEDLGIDKTPWRAYEDGEMPEEFARPLREALEATKETERRRLPPAPAQPKTWEPWMKVGAKVVGVGRWRQGMVGVVVEIWPESKGSVAIVEFGKSGDRFAFDPGELKEQVVD